MVRTRLLVTYFYFFTLHRNSLIMILLFKIGTRYQGYIITRKDLTLCMYTGIINTLQDRIVTIMLLLIHTEVHYSPISTGRTLWYNPNAIFPSVTLFTCMIRMRVFKFDFLTRFVSFNSLIVS